MIARESASRQPGTEIMLKRLTELLFIQVIRLWIDGQAEAHGGWTGALARPARQHRTRPDSP